MDTREIATDEALELIKRQESHFWDVKSSRSNGKVVQKIASAIANSDGGEFAIGIEDDKSDVGLDRWNGFERIEDGNHIVQAMATDVTPPVPYVVEWLSIIGAPERGLLCLVTVPKSASVHEAADGSTYVRRHAASIRISGAERVNLSLSKGSETYETQELADYTAEELAAEPELHEFLSTLSPKTTAADFIRKQRLQAPSGKARLAGAVLFAESPSAVSPKRCAVKIARYETKLESPDRKHLHGTPLTIEAPARVLIDQTIAAVQRLVESVSTLTPSGEMEKLSYPPDALKEVIVNAVIHRDYNISDDILIKVFDNRVEIRSPGRLPGHMTLDNLFTDRFSRNPAINRLINKYPDPPNKDIGEGLRTVLRSMSEARLKEPKFSFDDNYFIVRIEHTSLARPQEIVMEYMQSHEEITNSIARELTGIDSENSMKDVFYTLRDAGKLERVPGKHGSRSAWQLVQSAPPITAKRAHRRRFQPRRLTRSQRRRAQQK